MKFLSIIVLSLLFSINAFSLSKITISGDDKMQFSLKEFEVKAGEPVELIFKNEGKLPKIAMGHNLVILTKVSQQLLSEEKQCRRAQMLQMHYPIQLKAMFWLTQSY